MIAAGTGVGFKVQAVPLDREPDSLGEENSTVYPQRGPGWQPELCTATVAPLVPMFTMRAGKL